MKENNQWIWIIIAVCAVLFISLLGFSGMGGYGMMNGYYGGMGLGMGLFGGLFMILIVVALILFIIWLVKQIQK